MNPQSRSRTRIKICGVKSVASAEAAIDAGADFVGLVFAPQSVRYINDFQVAADILDCIHSQTKASIITVGVFADPLARHNSDLEQWTSRRTWCQLHGDVDARKLRALTESQSIIRAVPCQPAAITHWDAFDGVKMLLIDNSTPGSGQSVDHSLLAGLMPSISKPILLAGGLTPANVGGAIRTVRPFGVDVSSGVETSPGVKDAGLIRAFCDAVRATDAEVD